MNPHVLYLEIGGILIRLGKYADAVRNYEMGRVYVKPDTNRLLARFNHCIGVGQVKAGEFHKALSHFEAAMKQDASIRTGYNLVLCHSVLSTLDSMKDAFVRMLAVRTPPAADESDPLGNQINVERREMVRLVMLATRLLCENATERNWLSRGSRSIPRPRLSSR